MSGNRENNTSKNNRNRPNNRRRTRQNRYNNEQNSRNPQNPFNKEKRFTKFKDTPSKFKSPLNRRRRSPPNRGRMGSEVNTSSKTYENNYYSSPVGNQKTYFENPIPQETANELAEPPMPYTPKPQRVPIPKGFNQSINQPPTSTINLNIKTEISKQNESKRTTSSGRSNTSGSESDDSTVKQLKKAVDNTFMSNNLPVTSEKLSENREISIKKEPEKKPSSSSSSSSDSDSSEDSSSSTSDDNDKNKQQSEEEVICLGRVENIENLVDDENTTKTEKCLLCDKSGHISFHCQMICKNCNGKYHGLKDCPKSVNISVVLSNFMQFCMKQCYKYNPNEKFNAGEQFAHELQLPQNENKLNTEDNNSKRKKITKKRKMSTESTVTSDTDTSTRKRKRRKSPSYSGIVPYTAFNQPFGFNPSSVVNPLIAFSQMMGYNTPMGFPNSQK